MLGMSSPSRSCDRCRAVPTRDHGRAQFAGARLAVESCPDCRAQKTTNPPTVGSSGSVRAKAEAGERLHFVSGGLVLVALVGELLDPPDRNNTRSREAPRTPRRPHLGQQARRACGRRTPWCRPDRTIPPLGVKFSGPYPLSGPQGKCKKTLFRTNPLLDPRSGHFSGLPDGKTCFPVFGAGLDRTQKIAESNFTPFLSKLLRKQKTVPYNKIPACPIFTLPCLQVLSGESQCSPATLSLPDFASHPLAVTPAPPLTCPPAHPSLHPAF